MGQPLFTLDELNAQIASFKQALLAISMGQEIVIDGETIKNADPEAIRRTLKWMESERNALLGSSPGLILNQGVVSR